MIRVIFKNVGQGDSIIVEWQDDSQKWRIAIIDCNLTDNTNPVLNHLIENFYDEIEYMVLTHPHSDHFSGFLEVLQYCKKNKIKVKYFLHTASQVPSYLKSATKSASATTELAKLFKFLKENYAHMNMEVCSISADMPNKTIPLTAPYGLVILSPTKRELDNYVKGAQYPFAEETYHDNPNANWLSMVLQVTMPNGYVLLTSDAPKTAIVRIDTKLPSLLSSELLLAQSPHHGAANSHNNTFWKKRTRKKNTPIVFSVGKNSYNHPHKDVVSFFIEHDYELYATNQVGILSAVPKNLGEAVAALDMFSSVTATGMNKLQGDQIFNFK